MNKIHKLKLKKMYFDDVRSGKKSFEIRFNDRGYQTGDLIEFRKVTNRGDEFYPNTNKIFAEIIYLFVDVNFLQEGYCVFSIKMLTQEEFRYREKMLEEVADA